RSVIPAHAGIQRARSAQIKKLDTGCPAFAEAEPLRLRAGRRRYDGSMWTLHQPRLLHGGADEGGEERVRLEGPRFQLWMELHADEPGMVGDLDDLRQ